MRIAGKSTEVLKYPGRIRIHEIYNQNANNEQIHKLWKLLPRGSGKKHRSITLSIGISLERNSFHSKKLSFANNFPRDDMLRSIILSSFNARGLNLNFWECASSSFLDWIFILIQRLANTLNILSNTWITKKMYYQKSITLSKFHSNSFKMGKKQTIKDA